MTFHKHKNIFTNKMLVELEPVLNQQVEQKTYFIDVHLKLVEITIAEHKSSMSRYGTSMIGGFECVRLQNCPKLFIHDE